MKKSLFVVFLLFGGLLPVFIYLIWHGSLGVLEVGEFQSVDLIGQLALMLSLFNIKPIYMFLCVVLLITLWGRTSLPARSLFWGLTALVTGELICGATFAAFHSELIISEHIHSYGMMLEFAFMIFALIELLDRHVTPDDSKIRYSFLFIAMIGIIVSFLPLTVSTTQGGYSADLFGFPYIYIRFAFNQWVESRVIPITSLCFSLLTLLTCIKSKTINTPRLAKIFLSAGAGPLAFSMMRLTLGALFVEHLVWFELWEEMTQFTLISTIVFLLWHFKREWMIERIALLR